MKSTEYSEKTLDHFRNPRNVGILEGENVAKGRVGNPVCGDLMEIYIEVEDDHIKDIKFQTFGCGSAVATSSMVTELVKGMSLDEAMKMTRDDVAGALDGLPPIKMHCSNLAADALHAAIKNWREGIRPNQIDAELPLYVQKPCKPSETPIEGESEFLGKGVYNGADDYGPFKDKRVIVRDMGDTASAELAIELDKHTGRVIFITSLKEGEMNPDIKKQLKRSDVKVLYESELLKIMGQDEVEKVLVNDLDEDQEYELFVDVVVIKR
ncbi:putative FeS cluster assembly scaffold protein NifU [delta proteobacterium NaphS2]|nr:putative FeS cluster assembly scaffold protein NifU [delta proteobacterium NaphS2]